MEATARIYFQKAPAKRTVDNLCPVKLCVTFKRERRYYSIIKFIKKNEWLFVSDTDIEKLSEKNVLGKYKDIKYEYDRITNEVQTLVNGISPFSFNLFEEKFLDKGIGWDNLFTAMWSHIQALKEENRIGYASSFESTLRAIKEFHTGKTYKLNPRKDLVTKRMELYTSGKPLNFIDITPTWLTKFEAWMKRRNKSRATMGIYVRNIRVLFNIAVNDHSVKAENPFKKHTPKSKKGSSKVALSAAQIGLIASYRLSDPRAEFYRDMFMFSFLGCGMNLSDLSRLRYSNIVDGELSFVREKTKNEEDVEDPLKVPVSGNMMKIISKHGNKAVGFDPYIFPILKDEWTDKQKYSEIKQLTKMVNRHVRTIAKAVGINEHCSSMTARHSWATIAKNSGTSTEFISETLGHSSVIVTKFYLKSFERSTRKEHSDKMENEVYNSKVV